MSYILARYDKKLDTYVAGGNQWSCTARKTSDGRYHKAGDICGAPGHHQIGDIWLCHTHYERTLAWRRAQAVAEGEALTPQDACVYPAEAGRLAPPTVRLCAKPADHMVGDAGFCDRHFKDLWQWHREMVRLEEAEHIAFQGRIRAAHEAEMRRWDAQGSQIVYYIRRLSDGAIKIGTTTRPVMRWPALKWEHGPIEILATHCGDGERERQMHARFADLRFEGEWFRPGAELVAWIIHVRRKRVNVSTRMPETVPLKVVTALLEQSAAEPAA